MNGNWNRKFHPPDWQNFIYLKQKTTINNYWYQLILNTYIVTVFHQYGLGPPLVPSCRQCPLFLRRLFWLQWTTIWNRLLKAGKSRTSLLLRAGRSCWERVFPDPLRTPRLCLSGSSACWWRMSSGWRGPSLQTLRSFSRCLVEQPSQRLHMLPFCCLTHP